MVSVQSESRTRSQNEVTDLINNSSTRRRVYLFAVAALSFLLIITDKLLAEPIGHVASPNVEHKAIGDRALLTVTSSYEHPIVIATLRGYAANDCNVKLGSGDTSALTKITLLSDSVSSKSILFNQVGRPERIANNSTSEHEWKTKFRLNIAPPPLLSHIHLCYAIEYRSEYIDEKTALADFPPKLCSFRGKPRFHRVWDSSEFINYDQQKRTQDNWLVRKNINDDWHWSGITDLYETATCLSWKQERPYTIVIIGDSQPSYMCKHLVYGVTGDINATQHLKVRCVQIKQTLQNSTTFDRYVSELQHSKEDFVIFNPSGLWEAAYGSLDMFRQNFQKLLTYIPTEQNTESNTRQHFFLAPTTAVHPINYPDLPADDRKWSMTQPRIRAINSIARELVLERKKYFHEKSFDTVSVSILPTPWDSISLSREDDPMSPTDMVSFTVAVACSLLRMLY